MGCCSCNSTPFLFSQEALNILSKKNYWCPIKIAKPIKVYLNRSICAVEISISKFQAPKIRKE